MDPVRFPAVVLGAACLAFRRNSAPCRADSELNLSERRLTQGKPSNPTRLERTAGSPEEQLREALDHMGGRRLGLASGSRPDTGRGGGPAATQRHRYVRDGEVPVVHAALGPQVARSDAALHRDRAVLDALRHDLDRERAAREAAERSLQEARATLTVLQTRLVHLEMDLQSAQEHAAEHAAAQAAPAPIVSADSDPDPAPTRRRTRAPRAEAEPQPVKWWIKTDKS